MGDGIKPDMYRPVVREKLEILKKHMVGFMFEYAWYVDRYQRINTSHFQIIQILLTGIQNKPIHPPICPSPSSCNDIAHFTERMHRLPKTQ
jgi:hypothetical protein